MLAPLGTYETSRRDQATRRVSEGGSSANPPPVAVWNGWFTPTNGTVTAYFRGRHQIPRSETPPPARFHARGDWKMRWTPLPADPRTDRGLR